MINQLFHKYGTYKQFNQNLVGGLIHKDAICFIEETRQIYAQGKLYAVSLKDFQKYEEIIQTHQKKFEEIQAAEIETRQKVNALELSKGAANGLATLDESGRVPSYQLPSYVDDVLEFSSMEFFPTVGESGKIYLDKMTNRQYRWSGTQYIEISNTIALEETSDTAHYTVDFPYVLSWTKNNEIFYIPPLGIDLTIDITMGGDVVLNRNLKSATCRIYCIWTAKTNSALLHTGVDDIPDISLQLIPPEPGSYFCTIRVSRTNPRTLTTGSCVYVTMEWSKCNYLVDLDVL